MGLQESLHDSGFNKALPQTSCWAYVGLRLVYSSSFASTHPVGLTEQLFI